MLQGLRFWGFTHIVAHSRWGPKYPEHVVQQQAHKHDARHAEAFQPNELQDVRRDGASYNSTDT